MLPDAVNVILGSIEGESVYDENKNRSFIAVLSISALSLFLSSCGKSDAEGQAGTSGQNDAGTGQFGNGGGLFDEVGDNADRAEMVYSEIWNKFYGVGNLKKFFKAKLDVRPDGKPNIILDKAKGAAKITIRISVDEKAYEDWKKYAHKRIETSGIDYKIVEPGRYNGEYGKNRDIGGKVYCFGMNEESAIGRWEMSGKSRKANVKLRVETVDFNGKSLRHWTLPLDEADFRFLGYSQFTFNYMERCSTVRCERMSQAEMSATANVRCTVIDDADVEAERSAVAKNNVIKLISPMTDVPGLSCKIGKYEVTQDLWVAVMGENPSEIKPKNGSATSGQDVPDFSAPASRSQVKVEANCPVQCVSWYDCRKFIMKLNEITGRNYRLPTAEEWKVACRAGGNGRFGALADGTEGLIVDIGWYLFNSANKPHPVGQKKPNAFGIYDMHGNVMEWTSTQDGGKYVACGGSFLNESDKCVSDSQSMYKPDFRCNFLGFRLASPAGQ